MDDAFSSIAVLFIAHGTQLCIVPILVYVLREQYNLHDIEPVYIPSVSLMLKNIVQPS